MYIIIDKVIVWRCCVIDRMAVLEGCKRDYLQVAARVLPLLAGQPNEEEYKGLSESFHMSLRLCIKVAG